LDKFSNSIKYSKNRIKQEQELQTAGLAGGDLILVQMILQLKNMMEQVGQQ
jgi:hypothetical protein